MTVTNETIQVSEDETGQSRASGKRSVRSHPVFPVLVALWFAALLGIGSFVLPTAVIESLVSAARVADFVPAAAPPLGQTARIILSVAAAFAGGVFGLVLARIITSLGTGNQSAGTETQYFISAHEELGAEGFDRPFGDVSLDEEDAVFENVETAEAENSGPGGEAAPFEEEIEVAEEAYAPPAPRQPTAADLLLAKPLPEMGMVELVERFALSLQRHSPPQVPAQQRRTATEVFPADFMENPSPRPFERPRIVTNAEIAADLDANPAETERALRDALEKLQRMSGAA